MLKTISLRGFKSFVERDLDLNSLTVLTGLNSSGKSSVIQALLMLDKAANQEKSILLEGYGSEDELKNRYVEDNIKLSIEDDSGKNFTVKLDAKSDFDNQLVFPEIIYIGANRQGPQTSIPIYSNTHKKSKIGATGDNLLQYIQLMGSRELDEQLRHENSEGLTLEFNIKGWLSVISPNVDFDYKVNKKSDTSYATFDEHRAMNVGFGLSYALPVIVALLAGTITKNSLIIIENPEAHLHPRGQTEMAKLICLCAQVGAQVIIETHSDHIFDGIRIFAKQHDNFAENVQIHWFELNKNKNTEVYSPTLDDNGRLDEWPDGLFDQFRINASKLL